MNRTIASVALVLCLATSATVFAQQTRSSSPVRKSQASRPVRTARVVREAPEARRPVTTASHEIIDGDIIYEDPGLISSGGCQSCGGGGCESCGIESYSGSCRTCSAPGQFCICFPSHGWVHAEYLNWYPDGMRIPPLLTTSPASTPRGSAGVLQQNTTTTLLGGHDVLDDNWSGFRIRFGWWLASLPGWGVEGEYVGLGDRTDSYFRQSTGTPILARPFFNTVTGLEDSELVAYPGVVGGSISVDAARRFDGAAVRFKRQLCCTTGCGYSPISCQTVPVSTRLDATIGYRFWELKESLRIREQLTSQLTNEPGSFDIRDRFDTRNLFNGAELGVVWQGRRGWWSMDLLMRLGIGNNNQTVTINGNTAITTNSVTTNHVGGLYAQRTNIGSYERNKFTMVPELGATLGYQMTRRLRMTAGYSLVYIGNVVRPGDQVDLDVNPNLLPPENVPFTGALRPQFNFVETDYWIHGLSFGGEFRW